MKLNIATALFRVLLLCTLGSCAAPSPSPQSNLTSEAQQYVFSRSYLPGSKESPRGGTTQGPAVTEARTISEQWKALQNPTLSPLERDRRAILAMVGDFKATFEFVETISFSLDYRLARPYRSWATETVFVLEDSDRFISLQHIMVMYFIKDEKVLGPVVMKHWRQDWTYEPKQYHEYVGKNIWKRRRLSEPKREGVWLQEVFHVDDSPRYASVGRWKHTSSFSEWSAARTYRPLPRREHSVRSDYDVLDGVNRHVIHPGGWSHEQENYKRVLRTNQPDVFLSKEIGVNRYQRIIGQDFTAAAQYWQKSKAYWKAVRAVWNSLFETHPLLEFHQTINGQALFEKHFGYVETLPAPARKEPFSATAESFISPHVVK